MIRPPLIVLAPPWGQAALVTAMLGQHPDAHDLPDLSLFMSPTLNDMLGIFKLSDDSLGQGLLRAIAQFYCGGQTDEGITAAKLWLHRRADWTGAQLIGFLAKTVAPRQLIFSDTTAGWRVGYLDRLLDDCPDARILHLLQHPRPYGRDLARDLKSRLFVPPDFKDYGVSPIVIDPQLAWARVHGSIRQSFGSLPDSQYLQLRVETLFTAPEATLTGLADWIGLSTNPAAIAAMQHPELGVFSAFGPPLAPNGLDEPFLLQPYFARRLSTTASLQGPLEWREDGSPFAPDVIEIARSFGYR